MSNQVRYRRGDTKPVFATPASATVIEIGDLLFLDPVTSKPEPASAMVDQATEALNQDAFQQYFLGVAEQQSRNGDTDPIRIATAGEFEFDVASGTFTLGQMVGACETAAGTALEDQKVKTVTSETKAIGRVAEEVTTAKTSVNVRIKSTIMDGGVQAQAAGSSSGII